MKIRQNPVFPTEPVALGRELGVLWRELATSVNDHETNLIAANLANLANVGWDEVASGGTTDQPALVTYSKGTEVITADITWGTTGGEDGNITVIVYEHSANSGSSFTAMGTKTITYNADGSFASSAWS